MASSPTPQEPPQGIVTPELIRKEIESCLKQVRADIQQEKLVRAEKYAEYMRNWLAILTAVVTIAFVVFGLVGIAKYSDIEAYRKQIKTDTEDVSINTKKVSDAAATVTEVMGDLQPRVRDLEKKIDEIESRSTTAETKTKQLEQAVKSTNVVAQQTQLETTAFQSNLVGALAPDLSIPIVSKVPTFLLVSGASTIEGTNFGDSRGHLYLVVKTSASWAISTPILATPGAIELSASSIQSWTNNLITFVLSRSDYESLEAVRPKLGATVDVAPLSAEGTLHTFNGTPQLYDSQPSISFQIVTSTGKSSITSPSALWPIPPSQ